MTRLEDLDKLRDEKIDELWKLETELYSSKTQVWFENNATDVEQKDLIGKRVSLSNQIADLDSIRINKIADKFDANKQDLIDGINQLNATINGLTSSIATLNQIGTLIGTIAKILI
jgi:hypothetical protein